MLLRCAGTGEDKKGPEKETELWDLVNSCHGIALFIHPDTLDDACGNCCSGCKNQFCSGSFLTGVVIRSVQGGPAAGAQGPQRGAACRARAKLGLKPFQWWKLDTEVSKIELLTHLPKSS